MNAMSWLEMDQRYVWHPFTQQKGMATPLPVERGQGCMLYTSDGREILDGISSWWVNIHGHSHPRLNRAIAAQAEKLEHVLFAGCSHEPAAHLAAGLVAATPPALSKVFYSDNGSTAIEVAMKMAFQAALNRGDVGRRKFMEIGRAHV